MNPILAIFLRSMTMFVILVWGAGVTVYDAYWVAIAHDAISLFVLQNPLTRWHIV